MSGKLRLGKTKDSRTRKKQVTVIKIQEVEALKETLKGQEDFTNYLLKKGMSTATVQRCLFDTRHFMQWAANQNVPIAQVSYADVLHYIQSRRKSVKQKTISININSIGHYYSFLVATEKLAENPTSQVQIKGIKRKTLYPILSKQELESLYHHFENNPEEESKNQNWFKASQLVSKRNKIILGLLIYQGLGSRELAQLTEKDLKLREGKIYIAGSRRSNERELTLESHQIMNMMEYMLQTRKALLQLTGKQSEQLFVSTGESDRFNNIIQRLTKKLKQQHSKVMNVKQIRTSVITHWLKMYNLRQAQYMAGHRYVSSTEAYLVNDLEDLSEEIGKYHPIG